jgi:hypothetical protein
MATIASLCDEGHLVAIDPGLEPDELPKRRLFGTPEFVRWLDETLPGLLGDSIGADLSPFDQVYALFFEYVIGNAFSTDRRFKKLNGTPDHYVWEFKTDDVRVFGWVPQKDTFICCFGDSKVAIETFQKYGRYIAQTKFVRDNISLDAPKFIESVRYVDVISDEDRS